ncbi:hypothetical protein AAH131_25735, partial [Bacteroides ovatus]
MINYNNQAAKIAKSLDEHNYNRRKYDYQEEKEKTKNEVVSKRWHNLFYILQFCYIFFWLC